MKTFTPILILKTRDEILLVAMPPERSRKPFAFNAKPTGIGNAHPDDFENWQPEGEDDDQLRHWGSAFDEYEYQTDDEVWDSKSGQWIPKYILSL